MLDDGLRVHCSVPGTTGVSAVLSQLLKVGSVVTAYDDGLLRTVKAMGVPEGVDLVPFSELVGRYSRMWGLEGFPQATVGQRHAICTQLMKASDEDSFFHRSASYPGTAERVVEVIRELEHAGIGIETLRSVAQELDAPARRRLTDLIDLMVGQETSLGDMSRETSAMRIGRCMEAAAGPTPLKHVVALTHGEHAPLYDQWLAWLANRGVRVDLVAEPVWQECFDTAHRRLEGLAVAEIDHWTRGLFDRSERPVPVKVEMFRAPDALAECEWVVRRCLELRQEGFSDTDIAIVARDTDTYGPLLSAASGRLGVPLSASWNQPLLSNGMAGTVLAVLSSLVSHDVRVLGRAARGTVLTPAGIALKQVWEVLRECYAKGDSQWEELEARAEELTVWPWLTGVLEWRRMSLAQPTSLLAWTSRLRLLAAEISAGESPHTSDRDGRAQNVMQRSLMDLSATRSGEESMSLAAFVSLARDVWTTQHLAVTDRRGGVWVASSALGVPPTKVLFVLGMVEGSLPRRRSQDPVLGDPLRMEINRLASGAGKLLTSYDRAREERDEFVRLCALATDQLVMSFTEGEGDTDRAPSYYLRMLANMTGATFEQVLEKYTRSEWFPPEDKCLAMQDLAMARSVHSPVFQSPILELRETFLRAQMKLDPDAGTPIKEIADFGDCPFRSTARYRLNLFSARPVSPVHRLTDLPQRASLHLAPNEMEARQRLHKSLSDKLSALYSHLEPWEAHLLKAAGERLIEAWVRREFEARKVWPRSEWMLDGFPVSALRLGEGGTRDEIPLEGGQKVKVSTEPMPVYRVGPFLIVRMDETSLPDPKTMESEEGTAYFGSSKWLKHSMVLNCLWRASEAAGIEVETTKDRRWLLLLSSTDAALPQRHDIGLERRLLSDDAPSYRREAQRRTKEVLKQMLSGTIEARPGSTCTYCDYGGLCRKSAAILGLEGDATL